MYHQLTLPISLIIIAFLAISCSPVVHQMRGVVQNPQGLSEGQVRLQTTESPWDDNVQIVAILPDNERFSGRVVYDKVVTKDHFYNLGQQKPVEHSSKTYGSSAKAMLIGDKGHTMKCNFQLSSPSNGISYGGFGECLVSDGRIIPVQF